MNFNLPKQFPLKTGFHLYGQYIILTVRFEICEYEYVSFEQMGHKKNFSFILQALVLNTIVYITDKKQPNSKMSTFKHKLE